MFEPLWKWDRIYVTGPQRSGTSICARMICHDTDSAYIDGAPHNRIPAKTIREGFGRCENIVLQAPFLAHDIHLAVHNDPGALVVCMIRDTADIVASQKRIHWVDTKEMRRYPGETYETLAQAKYDRWEAVSRALCPNWMEVEYESLAAHPLWVPKEQRHGASWGKRGWRL